MEDRDKSKNKESLWPIHPRFISMRDDDSDIKKEVENDIGKPYNPNENGILRCSFIRGFLTDASDDDGIKNPMTLFQLVPNDFEIVNKKIEDISDHIKNDYLEEIKGNRKLIRIDPISLQTDTTCCNAFRESYREDRNDAIGGKCKCFGLDSRVLILYHKDLEKYYFRHNFKDYYETLKGICDKFNASIEGTGENPLKVEPDFANKKVYLYYKCNHSNLYEYFFPLFNSGRIIAVVMSGQRFGEDELFNNYRKGGVYRDKILVNIEKFDKSISESLGKRESKKRFSPEELVFIYNRIDILENNIKKEVIDASRRFVADTFLDIEKRLRSKLNAELKEINGDSLGKFKAILNDTLKGICNIFRINKFIRLYSSETNVEQMYGGSTTFELIGSSDSCKMTKLKFDKNALNDYDYSDVGDKDTIENANKGLLTKALIDQNIDIGSGDTFRIEPNIVGNTKILIWKRYDDELKRKHYIQNDNIYIEHLKSMYHTFWEPFNLIKAIILEKQLETVLRVSSHESAQIIPAISSALTKEYRIYNDISRSGRVHIMMPKTINDCLSRLRLLDGLYQRSTLIFKNEKPKKEWCDFHRSIYAVRTLLDEKAYEDKLQKIIIKDDYEILSKYNLYTNEQYLHQILFNLLDNAIKYGIRGTNIYVNIAPNFNYSLFEEDKSIKSIDISVVNYGQAITDSDRDRIFDLYYRSKGVTKTTEGLGVGLFLVKKLSTLLGYTFYKPTSNMVEKYNLPLLYYVSTLSDEERICIKDKDGRNINDRIRVAKIDINRIKEVVNTSAKWNSVGPRVFSNNIDKPIYRTEFRITLTKDNATGLFVELR